jgi:hypothetical protein
MSLVLRGGVLEWELHLSQLFFRSRGVSQCRLVRMTSLHLTPVLFASHEKTLGGVPPRSPYEEFPPRTSSSTEKPLRGVPALHE